MPFLKTFSHANIWIMLFLYTLNSYQLWGLLGLKLNATILASTIQMEIIWNSINDSLLVIVFFSFSLPSPSPLSQIQFSTLFIYFLESTILHFPNNLEHLTLHSRSLMQWASAPSVVETCGCWNVKYLPNCDYPDKGFAHGSCWKCVPGVRNLEPMLVGGRGGGTYVVIGTPYLLLLIFSSSLSSLIYPILHSNLEAKEGPKKTKPKEKKRERKRWKSCKVLISW